MRIAAGSPIGVSLAVMPANAYDGAAHVALTSIPLIRSATRFSPVHALRHRRSPMRSTALTAALAGVLCLSVAATASAGPAVRHMYGWQSSRLVPFDIDAAGQITERSDQGVTVAGSFRSFVIGRNAKTVYVGTTSSYYPTAPGGIRVYSVAADGSLSLAQSVPVEVYGFAFSPDGSRLFANLSTGLVASFAVNADGTLGSQAPLTTVGGGGAMAVAVSTDGATLYVAAYPYLLEQYAIGPNGSLTSQLPTDIGLCGWPTLSITPDGRQLDGLCSDPNGALSYALSPGGGMALIGGRVANAGGGNYAADPRGRALYEGVYPHWIEQMQRQPDGSLALFSMPSFVESTTVTAIAADPSGQVLAMSGGPNTLRTFAITADGSLSTTPLTTQTTSAWSYGPLSYAPLQPPVAVLSSRVSPAGVVTLDAAASHGAAPIARYDWTFGDGTSLADGGPAPTHVYPASGDYTATVTLTDALGCGATGTFGGRQSFCAGSSVARASTTVHVAAAPVTVPPAVPLAESAPAPERAIQPGQATEFARPLAAAAAPNASNTSVLLTWAKPAGEEPVQYLIAWSTLHSAQGPGDPNMRHLRVRKTNVKMRVKPRTTLHFAVYALGADGRYTRATKTTLRLPR